MKRNTLCFLLFTFFLLFNVNKVSANNCEYKVTTGIWVDNEPSSYTIEFYLKFETDNEKVYIKGKDGNWIDASVGSVSWTNIETHLLQGAMTNEEFEHAKDWCDESGVTQPGLCYPLVDAYFPHYSLGDEYIKNNQCANNIKVTNGNVSFLATDSTTNSCTPKNGEMCGLKYADDGKEVNKELYSCTSKVEQLGLEMKIFEIEGDGKYYSLTNKSGNPIGKWKADYNPKTEYSTFGSEYFTAGNVSHKINESEIDKIYTQCKNTGKFDIYANIITYYKDDSKTEQCAENEVVFTATNSGDNWHKDVIRCKTDVLHVDTENPIEFPGGGNCSSIVTGEFQKWLKSLFSLIRMASIILIIVLTGMDGIKSFASFEDKNSKAFYKRLLIRLICLAIIFLVPSIIEIFIDIASANENIANISGDPFCGIY